LVVYNAQFTNDWQSISAFRDTDGDGIPDWWEHINFLGATNAVSSALAANEINTLLEAYVAGLDPNNADEVFYIQAQAALSDTLSTIHVLNWPSAPGRIYDLQYSTNLLSGGFVSLPGGSGIPASPAMNTFTNTNPPQVDTIYYRAVVRLAE